MHLSDFDYSLPEELIARYPLQERSGSRLLVLNKQTAEITHGHFQDLLNYLKPNDLLVFNNSRVMAARFFGQKVSGAKIEILVERVLDSHTVLAHVRANKSLKIGTEILIVDHIIFEYLGREQELFKLQLKADESIWKIMEKYGHMPLPHYMQRDDEIADRERYQTVYANPLGSVAAPTAGLHFDKDLLAKIAEKGADSAFVTLHVGAGTFQPVRVERIAEHVMHSEAIEVSGETCQKVKKAKSLGGRVIAVGTTSVRCLETASCSGEIAPYNGETNIFIYPGYQFKVIDGLVTNFHLPKSSLLMLVSALAGAESIRNAYQEAIKERYRFFSYGDAMLIL